VDKETLNLYLARIKKSLKIKSVLAKTSNSSTSHEIKKTVYSSSHHNSGRNDQLEHLQSNVPTPGMLKMCLNEFSEWCCFRFRRSWS